MIFSVRLAKSAFPACDLPEGSVLVKNPGREIKKTGAKEIAPASSAEEGAGNVFFLTFIR